ncbi:hypothetical protein [Kordia jejudonensis]|uniref:hypothetical protein n=1 Tax=Kordia jejudonensis TaxID=1348245 RepID=UPI0006296325|nr:hypothetical protein [Kordia jejudonensis]
MSTKEDLQKELNGIENTIWAYKFEFHDMEQSVRLETIQKFEDKKKLVEAKIKALNMKDKINKLK